ncbi:hypothetical protein Pla175_51220 [Pirellulimonas nuda]|uniref:Uncharacterized protein n=1 Tax=Pirellulimonas nuda TaxID=2528009 RepID=A0A518DJS4_9BACT|nr:circularly permuted type 2 ATP-grasp protein [Pirellulimonas nuda]QDU91692.1 hypothetical protein Pla175_51220 [Pirellulimonas nuda]
MSMAKTPAPSATGPSASMSSMKIACPPGVYNEAFDDSSAGRGAPRPHWDALFSAINALPAGDFAERAVRANRLLQEDGVTFDVFAREEEARGPLKLDLLPLIEPADDWQAASHGLDQRARLLDEVVRDLHGPQRLVRQGLLPGEVVFRHPGFLRAFHGLRPAEEPRLDFYAAELARSPSGAWWVMADRTDAPTGLGFAIENRLVSLRSVPQLLHDLGVQRIASFFAGFQQTLTEHVARRADAPRIALLTSGPEATFHFEDVFLARYLGFTLVEGGDLAVRNSRVFLKTLDGLAPIDVLFSRGNERGLDPLELGGAWRHGVPGLLGAVRAGGVKLANTPGCGLVEAPILMAFLPPLCQALLGEPLAMPSVATWWCGDASALAYVLANLESLVVKPAFEPSGREEIIVHKLSIDGRRQLADRIRADPAAFVAQELIARSAAPVWHGDHLEAGHVAVRAFSYRHGEQYRTLPGGLVRVAPTSEPMELAITAGDQSKDLWVLAGGEIDRVTLLEPPHRLAPLRRTGAMFPSRVADNLFWLGISMQRSDHLARLIRCTVDRLSAESEKEVPEVATLARALVQVGQIAPDFVLEDFSRRLPSLAKALPRAACDPGEPRGLAGSVAELRRLASQVRDWISHDTWRRLHGAAGAFLHGAASGDADLELLNRLLDDLLGGLAAATGLVQEGMTRGPAWRFLDMGRRIEAARNVASLVDAAAEAESLARPEVLKALLDVVNCQMTYRVRYLDRMQQHAVMDLVLVDETNPHSLAYQVVRLAEHVEALPSASNHPLRSLHARLAIAAVHAVRMLTLEELAESPPVRLISLFSEIETGMSDLRDRLTAKYLVHSGPPRQMAEDPMLRS